MKPKCQCCKKQEAGLKIKPIHYHKIKYLCNLCYNKLSIKWLDKMTRKNSKAITI